MTHYYEVPVAGSGHAGDPYRPYRWDDATVPDDAVSFHYFRGQSVLIESSQSIAVYEHLADDEDSGVTHAVAEDAPDTGDGDADGEDDSDDADAEFVCDGCDEEFETQQALAGHTGSCDDA